MPSESGWEIACRAGTDTDFHSGDGEVALGEAGWFFNNSENEMHSVGGKKPNDWGLHDMHGSVWEWCQDEWDQDAYAKRGDGELVPIENLKNASNEDKTRVLRGGSWGNSATDCRSAIRYGDRAGLRYWFNGFRVCLFPGPVDSQPDE